MEYTIQELDGMCGRLDHLAEELHRLGFASGTKSTALAEEKLVAEAIVLIQRIGESLAWAYGQHHRPDLGEQFAQPFVDRRLRDRLRDLLGAPHPNLQAQVLQTIHILLQATPVESTLFCIITSGYYLNQVVSASFDFKSHEDLLPLWMTVVKDIAVMINSDNMMLFYDPSSPRPFPIFTEAILYYHHPVSQVRTHVQATSLEVFLKLKDEDDFTSALFQLVLAESAVLFTHVCCLLRDFWRMADDAVRSGARRDVRNALHIQNDILMYLNDVFMCEIPELSSLLQDKLLRFAVLPVLMGSALRMQQQAVPSQETAWYLLCDLMATLRSPHVLGALAAALLRPHVPEEVLQLVGTPPPRTPTAFFTIQAAWGGLAKPGPMDLQDLSSDEALYASPPVTVMGLFQARIARTVVRNQLLDVLVDRLSNLGPSAQGSSSCVIAALELLLQALRASREPLDGSVAERLSGAVCDCLSKHNQLPWAVCLGALRALRELIAATDLPPGRSRLMLSPKVREKVLTPLADELLQDLAAQRQQGWGSQEFWLQEFQGQWLNVATDLSELPDAYQLGQTLVRHNLPEPGVETELPGAPAVGRARSLRVLLAVHRLALWLAASCSSKPSVEMPGLDEAEKDESMRFQPGVPVHVGKMNRVKCHAKGPSPGLEQEAVYLLPTQCTLLLVRPDDQKPFWAVPVVAEPLRLVRLAPGDENAGYMLPNTGPENDDLRLLRLEVSNPRSFSLRTAAPSPGWDGPLAGGSVGHDIPLPAPGSAELLPSSLQSLASYASLSSLEVPVCKSEAPVQLALSFSDERRRRVAWKVVAQARHQVCQRLSQGVEAFLIEIHRGLPL
ncbi:unnamed protein product [Polarella glacialis]|uniref:FPL domain-containing protein n=1 Tax=Polarella glacialis TaxID=89957 RepID=A0A813JWI1_POLGL|nr:unnamed protein product [Polarella glacialis]